MERFRHGRRWRCNAVLVVHIAVDGAPVDCPESVRLRGITLGLGIGEHIRQRIALGIGVAAYIYVCRGEYLATLFGSHLHGSAEIVIAAWEVAVDIHCLGCRSILSVGKTVEVDGRHGRVCGEIGLEAVGIVAAVEPDGLCAGDYIALVAVESDFELES